MDSIKKCFKNDQFAERSNIELLSVSPGHATAKMTLHAHHLNAVGTIHGGAIFTLADFTFAVAANSHGTIAVAINANINFIKAANTGTLWAEARETSRNSQIGSYVAEVKDEKGDLVAQFQGLAYRKNDKLPGLD
ncbi:MAG TPA: PaaI family thioesterase [Verrucomicrobiae bacterium]|nr:PaaI family thioesterase [Verrucomicrobiae bacterium]